MSCMGHNTPRDYLGYSHTANMTHSEKLEYNKQTVLSFAPCYDPDADADADSNATADACFDAMMRIAYLNQQSDRGSLTLRALEKCLTDNKMNNIALTSDENATKIIF